MAFKRLAYHRSWFLICFGLIGIALVTLFVLDRTIYSKRWLTKEEWLAPLLGFPFALLILVRGLTGSWSRWQLRVDIPAGKIHFPEGKVGELAELGALSIVKKPYRSGRHVNQIYQLHTAGLERPLFTSFYEGETKLRLDRLELAILQSALRRVLEAPAGEVASPANPHIAHVLSRLSHAITTRRSARAPDS